MKKMKKPAWLEEFKAFAIKGNAMALADGTIDILNFIPFEVKISGSIQQLNQDLNAAFTETELASLLQPTGITLVKDEFLIPPHRTDLTLWEHILKEISRIQSARRK